MLDEKLVDIYEEVLHRNPGENEFHQAVHEVVEQSRASGGQTSASTQTRLLIRRLCEPERQIIFRVPWVDDAGPGTDQPRLSCRVQLEHSAPFKGGLRFHPSVYLGVREVPRLREGFQERPYRDPDGWR